jgi:hypothetical protein
MSEAINNAEAINNGCWITDFTLSGLATPDELNKSAQQAGLQITFKDIIPEKAFRRYSKFNWVQDGEDFESRIAFEDEERIVTGLLVLQDDKNNKKRRIQKAAIVFDKKTEKASVVVHHMSKQVVKDAADFLFNVLSLKMSHYDHHGVRPKVAAELTSLGCCRMFNGTQGSWIVPGALKEEHDAVHAWAKENLSESKVRKFQVVTGEGDTDLTESVSESITVQLEAISKELEGWNEKEKGLRPKTIANRIERLSKLQAQAEIYENALNFKMNGVNETLSAKKAEILELLNSLNEKEAA